MNQRTCELPGCEAPLDSTRLCISHYAQKAKTPLTAGEFILGFKRQEGRCPYCLDDLGLRFQMDHHHGPCHSSHGVKRMCRGCIRGMIHRECNEELKWLELALEADRAGILADHVAVYFASRPFNG